MMSTLNSSLLSLKNSAAVVPPAQPQPPAPQSKRFAAVMAKVQAAAPQAAPSAPVKPTVCDNGSQTGPSSEASRAEANARDNAKIAARALANRAQVKATLSEEKSQTEPHIEPHQAAADSVPSDQTKAHDDAALSADMAAWVAALNAAAVNPAAAAPSRQSGEVALSESELATQRVTQAEGQAVADKNTQVLREDAAADNARDAQHGGAHSSSSQRGATHLSQSSAGSDGAASPQSRGQQSESRGSREASDVRAVSRTLAAQQSDLQKTAPDANAMSLLGNEATSAASALSTSTATSTATSAAPGAARSATDFSALMLSSMSAAGLATNGTSSAAHTVTLSLTTPVNAPEFREALGVQVSLMAREGLQTAELHLNPAEMGPVSVQIVMDGNQARVDFGADVAATRAAIEASMPELASALRDAGFTLAGGGVSQHAKGQDPSDSQSRQGATRRNIAATASVASVASVATTPPTRRRMQLTAGGVDLFA